MNEEQREKLLVEVVEKIDDMNSILYELNEMLREQEPIVAYALNHKIVRLQNSIMSLKKAAISSIRNDGMPTPSIVRKIF